MKAKIESVEFIKEYQTQYGLLYQHKVKYNDKTAFYSSKKKEQTHFVAGKECEFVENKLTGKNGDFWVVKLPSQNQGGYNKKVKREQQKYSGFAMSYAKDLVIADKIKISDMSKYTKKMFALMVELDKTLES
jgi:hypothetical protein